jgi:hypothetical protein
MRKTICFHVGTVKTGSTYLQKTLWENKEPLEEIGVRYLKATPPKLSLPAMTMQIFCTIHQCMR